MKMMKQIRVLTYVVSLGLLLSLTGCSEGVKQSGGIKQSGGVKQSESVKLEIKPDNLALDLQRAESERQDLMARIGIVTRVSDDLQRKLRTRLQKQVGELTQSRDKVQEQISQLSKSRDELQKRIGDLIQARDVAAVEAQQAQEQRDALESQLAAEMKTVGQLRDHLAQIRKLQGTIEKLQSELAQVVRDGSTTSGSAKATPGDEIVAAPAEPN